MNIVSGLPVKSALKTGWMSALLLMGSAHSAKAVEWGVGVDISTLGPGASLLVGVGDTLNFRLGHNAATVSDTFTEDGITYDADLELSGTSLLLDWHVFDGVFRLTAGVVANGTELNGTAIPTGNVNIGGTDFTPAQVGQLNATTDFDSAAPYVGIGWGTAVATSKGFSFAADIGVMYTGDADFELTQQGGTFTIPQSNLDAEEQNVENELDDYEFYPILRVGIAYHF